MATYKSWREHNEELSSFVDGRKKDEVERRRQQAHEYAQEMKKLPLVERAAKGQRYPEAIQAPLVWDNIIDWMKLMDLEIFDRELYLKGWRYGKRSIRKNGEKKRLRWLRPWKRYIHKPENAPKTPEETTEVR
jgi:hypothetical protein